MSDLFRTQRRVFRTTPMSDAVAEIAAANGWPRVHDVARSIEAATDRELIWEVTPDLALSYLESYLTNDSCLTALGTDPDQVERLIGTVASTLGDEILDLDELLDDVVTEQDPQLLCRAVIRLALGVPLEFDEAFAAPLAAVATTHGEAPVREFAICAMAYTEWGEFVPALRQILAADPEEQVRVRAEIVLNAFRAVGLEHR